MVDNQFLACHAGCVPTFSDCENLTKDNRIKIPPSFCIRQCGEDIFTTMLTAGGNKWGIVYKKVAQSLSKSCICH